jgi:hypothetical protein
MSNCLRDGAEPSSWPCNNFLPLKSNQKMKSSTNGFHMNWMIMKQIAIMKCALHWSCIKEKKKSSSLELWCAVKSGPYTTTTDDLPSGFIIMKRESTSQSQSCIKWRLIVTIWRSAAGVIHYNFLNPGETVTAEKYCCEIETVHQKLRKKQPAVEARTTLASW